MKLQNSTYALLVAPILLFVAALGVLCFEYERRLDFHRSEALNSKEMASKLEKEIIDLNYMLNILGGSECTMKLQGLNMQIDQLNLDLTEAYTDVAYCDGLDKTLTSLRMTIIELENELGRL